MLVHVHVLTSTTNEAVALRKPIDYSSKLHVCDPYAMAQSADCAAIFVCAAAGDVEH